MWVEENIKESKNKGQLKLNLESNKSFLISYLNVFFLINFLIED